MLLAWPPHQLLLTFPPTRRCFLWELEPRPLHQLFGFLVHEELQSSSMVQAAAPGAEIVTLQPTYSLLSGEL